MGKSFRDELFTGMDCCKRSSIWASVLTEVGEIGLQKSQTPNPGIALVYQESHSWTTTLARLFFCFLDLYIPFGVMGVLERIPAAYV